MSKIRRVIELRRRGVTLQLVREQCKEKHADGFQHSQFCSAFGHLPAHLVARVDELLHAHVGSSLGPSSVKAPNIKAMEFAPASSCHTALCPRYHALPCPATMADVSKGFRSQGSDAGTPELGAVSLFF
jgi:hypothetical protein